MADTLLEVRGLTTHFHLEEGTLHAVQDVSFDVHAGGRLGIVGESGCGKTVTALSVLGLIEPPGEIVAGAVVFKGWDLRALSEAQLRRVRGAGIGTIMQDPSAALNPVQPIGLQIVQAMRAHQKIGKPAAMQRAQSLLAEVGLPTPVARLSDYPHNLSGGMRQRVGIALALCCNPSLIIADEPTTALDVTVQAQILDLLGRLGRTRGVATILISHDLAVVANFAERVLVMYGGRVVEHAERKRLFNDPRHPYTRSLVRSATQGVCPNSRRRQTVREVPADLVSPEGCAFRPRCELHRHRELCRDVTPPLEAVTPGHEAACHFHDELAGSPDVESVAQPSSYIAPLQSGPILVFRNVSKHYIATSGLVFRRVIGRIRAVDDVSIAVQEGETFALVGESGCGKTTLAKVGMRLIDPTAGHVVYRGRDITALPPKDMRPIRRELQMVFQDPFASLNPRLRVHSVLQEPLRAHGLGGGAARVAELLDLVGLSASHARRFPHELSGGQRQRVAIARALAPQPTVLYCDEPVSSLDVTLRDHILGLLLNLQRELRLTLVLVSHDLSMVRGVAERVGVMYCGSLVELGSVEAIFGDPLHPYTIALLSAIPTLDPVMTLGGERVILSGDVPAGMAQPSGCPFRSRCWKAEETCRLDDPPLVELAPNHWAACHFPETAHPLPGGH